jgi:hypothetical protein
MPCKAMNLIYMNKAYNMNAVHNRYLIVHEQFSLFYCKYVKCCLTTTDTTLILHSMFQWHINFNIHVTAHKGCLIKTLSGMQPRGNLHACQIMVRDRVTWTHCITVLSPEQELEDDMLLGKERGSMWSE